MAQQIIPAAQLVPKFQGIGRCNNYDVLQSIPCSLECKIVGHILLDHPLSYALTATADVPAVYQIVVDKVSAFYKKFLAQPGQTMFKDVIQYPRFTKLIIADLMKKFPSIPLRLRKDYHSIKDDIPLVSVYTTGNVTVRGMLIPDAFLTEEICTTDDYKEYEMVFVNVDVPMNQPQLVVEGEKDVKSYADKFAASMIHDDVDDSGDRIEPESHKEHPKVVVDDDDNKEEKKDEKEGDEMGSLETRTEKMKTPITTTPGSHRINLSLDKNIAQEFTDTVSLSTATTSKDPHKKQHISSKYNHLPGALGRMCTFHPTTNTSIEITSLADLQQQLYLKMKSNLQYQANDPTLWDVLKQDDAPSEGEKRVKRHKTSKSSKSARGSSSKRSAKDSITYVSKQQQQEMDAWEDKTIIDKDEVIPVDETPELIKKIQNVDKRVPTIFDRARMETTLNDMLNLFFLKNGNTKEKKYILSLHKIHVESFPEADLEEKMNHWVRKKFKNFNEDAYLLIQHWKDSWHKRVYKKNQRRVRDNPEDHFSNQRITEVVRITTNQLYGLDFMEQIIMMRENDKPYSFSEADFKYLNKNDIEDLYYLCRNKKVNYHETKLMNSLITFIKSRVIWERVHDFQLGIESYQIRVNLTAPTLTFPGIKAHEPYSIVEQATYGILNEVKLRIFQSQFWKKPPLLSELDLDIMRAFEREISKSLSHRQQMRRQETFVNGRPILPIMKHL
ncbi:hypothetical protein Tco_0260864 [Tanacetum coccineum]